MYLCWPARACTSAIVVASVTLMGITPAPAADVILEHTICHDAGLARQRTEIDADVALTRFDPALGVLLEVLVPVASVALDTDGRFENTAASAVTFAEHMNAEITFSLPGGLASPAPLVQSLERVPPTALGAFDGVLDYAGVSAVTQPTTTMGMGAPPSASSDPAVLGAFTGPGTVAVHVGTQISEVFTGGGGNVSFEINTFAAASVRVCYRYATVEVSPTPPVGPPPTVVPRFTG